MVVSELLYDQKRGSGNPGLLQHDCLLSGLLNAEMLLPQPLTME